jgi:cell division protease FtsH
MSAAIGPISVLPPAGEEINLIGADWRSPAESTRELVDREVRVIVDQCHERALELLRNNRERLDHLAATLLERETLDEADARQAAGL